VKKTEQAEKKSSSPGKTDPAEPDASDPDAIKLDTTLVVIPVIASDSNLLYIPDMKKDEFTLYEDAVTQEIVFFGAIKEPFHLVLMLDTSGSTREKLSEIQHAARSFVEQLQPADRVKVISFDDQVRTLCNFTSDRSELRTAIDATKPGQGTKLYDATNVALASLAYLPGRKAIVMFTDGVDMRSDSHTGEDNWRAVEESGVIIYPIRYDTRADTEALLRSQNRLPGTPPTTGSDLPPPDGRRGPRDPRVITMPPPIVINRPPTGRYPDGGNPGGRSPFPDGRSPDRRFPDPTTGPDTRPTTGPPARGEDAISVMLDREYAKGDQYLNQLVAKSGGRLERADTLTSLPAAFARIADELRTQYALGYYPTNSAKDGTYRTIRVRTSRRNVRLRARPGYTAGVGASR
jgi:hypothetical protein